MGFEFYYPVTGSYVVSSLIFHADGTPFTLGDPTYAVGPGFGNAGIVNDSLDMDAVGAYVNSWDGDSVGIVDPANPTPIGQNPEDPAGIFAATAGPDADPRSPFIRANRTLYGTQQFPSVAVTPNGDWVIVWQGNGVGDTQGIFARRFDEPTDTVGPVLTDYLLPDGTPVETSRQVTQPIYAVVLTFDEELSASTATDAANYKLLQDGVNVYGGISQAFYGLDEAYQLSGQYGLNAQRTNKWQVVLIVDANGDGPGTEPLTDGQYQIVALNSIRDKVGNPLRGYALNPNGNLMSQVINVTLPTGQETKVASGQTLPGQNFGKYTTANTADAVASDAEGDYVVAWTDTTPGHQGVWAKLYSQTSVLNADGTRTTTTAPYAVINPVNGLPWANDEILISSDTTARDVSVARSIDGDFVVTWTAWTAATNWDVYAQMFDATGQSTSGIFQVNSTTANAQQYSSVAMDADGDFIIAWQSNAQDGSGYGVFARGYLSSGVSYTGEFQVNDTTTGDQNISRRRHGCRRKQHHHLDLLRPGQRQSHSVEHLRQATRHQLPDGPR